MKICKTCKQSKNESEFYFRNYLYRSSCKECERQMCKDYKMKNKNEIKSYNKKYKENNRLSCFLYNKEYKLNNKESIKLYKNNYEKTKRATSDVYKLRQYMSISIGSFLKSNSGSKAGNSILNYLNYTIQELKDHLEKQFEPWMTWENHGKYEIDKWDDNDQSTWTWQLDHIIPKSDLPSASMEEENFKKCWSLDNLRPLSAKQNIIDGAYKIRHKMRNYGI